MDDAISSAAPEDPFGSLLFQRKRGRWGFGVGAILTGAGAAFFGYGAIRTTLHTTGSGNLVLWILAGVCLLIAVACGRGFSRGDLILLFFQKGVTRSHAGRIDRLPYESVASIA